MIRNSFVIRHWSFVLAASVLAWAAAFYPRGAFAADAERLLRRAWFESSTAHFNIYSCGDAKEVVRVAARLEQFRDAYSILAGAQSVASPPIVVIAFPDHATMEPFLPLYHGKPSNLAAFFHRGSDENFIALYLSGNGAASLGNVFHEYTHLLLRRNQLYWPIWLNEGMAEIYSTFEIVPNGIRIGAPHEQYLRLLSTHPLLPLSELFAVTHDAPEYNERERQGIFYAESWLLAHYLMLGEPINRPRFSDLTALLRQGQPPAQAFTNAFKVSLRQMENQLRRYLDRGRFDSLTLAVKGNLSSPVGLTTRVASPDEVSYRLGDMLLRVDRFDDAAEWFGRGEKMAPGSPLPHEGFGLLAEEKSEPAEAVRQFAQAASLGPIGFLSHYTWAKALLETTAKKKDAYTKVQPQTADQISSELQRSLALMPSYAAAHELLGFFLMVQGDNLPLAERHLQTAIDLEPDNQAYLFSLAQLQWRSHKLDAARRTLEPLRLSYASPKLRTHAEEMLREINSSQKP